MSMSIEGFRTAYRQWVAAKDEQALISFQKQDSLGTSVEANQA